MVNILSLPADIIHELFVHASLNDPLRLQDLEDDRGHKIRYDLGWIYLTHVCRRLRTIGIDAASLWASIVAVFPDPDIMDAFISRAKGCALTLSIHDMHPQIQQGLTRDDIERFQRTCQYLDRAGTLYCYSPHFLNHRDGALNQRLATARLPSLLHLVLENDQDSRRNNSETLQGLKLDAPRLATARLSNALLRPVLPLDNLRELDLFFDRKLTKFHLAEIVRQLTYTPRLQSLSLREEWDRVLVSQEAPFVQLDHLKSIDVCLKSTTKMALFLESVHAPNLSAARINVIHARPTDSLPAVLFAPLHSIHRTLPTIELVIAANGLLISSTDGSDEWNSRCFYDPNLRKPVVYGLHLCDLSVRMHTDCVEKVLTHLAPALDRIRRCRLDEPTSRGIFRDSFPLDAALDDTPSRHAALKEFGEALTTATILDLDLGIEGLKVLRLLTQVGAVMFPAIHTLVVTTTSDKANAFVAPRDAPECLMSLLTSRAKLGFPLQRLEVLGLRDICSSGRHCYKDAWDAMAERSLDRGLTKDVVDRREKRASGLCISCERDLGRSHIAKRRRITNRAS